MKKLIMLGLSAFSAGTANAQGMTCGTAQYQLQQYVGRVNYLANMELYQGIPQRCMGNGQCMMWWQQQLSMWYAQQASLVNNYYFQIVNQCSSGQGNGSPPAPDASPSPDGGGISEEAVQEIDVDDRDRTVAIRIPSRPPAFRTR